VCKEEDKHERKEKPKRKKTKNKMYAMANYIMAHGHDDRIVKFCEISKSIIQLSFILLVNLACSKEKAFITSFRP
jgi:hypothetical protein